MLVERKKEKERQKGVQKIKKRREAVSEGGSNPKGGVRRGKEQLESHTPLPLSLFSSKKR